MFITFLIKKFLYFSKIIFSYTSAQLSFFYPRFFFKYVFIFLFWLIIIASVF